MDGIRQNFSRTQKVGNIGMKACLSDSEIFSYCKGSLQREMIQQFLVCQATSYYSAIESCCNKDHFKLTAVTALIDLWTSMVILESVGNY